MAEVIVETGADRRPPREMKTKCARSRNVACTVHRYARKFLRWSLWSNLISVSLQCSAAPGAPRNGRVLFSRSVRSGNGSGFVSLSVCANLPSEAGARFW